MISAQVASKMKKRLVSFIAILLIISLEMMGGTEGKPQPGPQPAPGPQPQPAPGPGPAPLPQPVNCRRCPWCCRDEWFG